MPKEERQATERRPIASREAKFAKRIAAWLIVKRISPNSISISSIVFATAAFASLLSTPLVDPFTARLLFLVSAFFVQCRLLANLFDGMVAVESGQSSKLGELYNDIPDRIADALILIGAGYALGGAPLLGYAAATLALFVTYLRVIGNSVGAQHLFFGPMAKQQRMATVTAATIYSTCAPSSWPGAVGSDTRVGVMTIALTVILFGCAITAVRRISSTRRQIVRMN